MPAAVTQRAFHAALLDPGLAPPPGLLGPTGAAANKRFDVYRNNVAVSLKEALCSGFPVLERLLGAEFFDAMAGVFLRSHPPSSPMLMLYGADMPAFLEGFPPVAHLPYLPDIARLELALRESYHAADADPADPARLAALPEAALPGLRLKLSPALRIVPSDYPVHGIWLANTLPDAPRPGRGAETALVTRPGFDPQVDVLSPAEGALVAALAEGVPLGEAVPEGTDISRVLTLLLSRKAVTEFLT
jgi:hypothetical protein